MAARSRSTAFELGTMTRSPGLRSSLATKVSYFLVAQVLSDLKLQDHERLPWQAPKAKRQCVINVLATC
jgi:hypothetical protein